MAQAKILVADDSQVIVHMLSTHFSRLGYQVVAARNGKEALQVALREKPDLAILDVMMPELDGYQVCAQLRKLPDTAKMPVMLLTARGGVADRITGLQAGADDYVPKPFDLRELTLRAQALLARAAKPAEKKVEKARVITCFSLKGGVGVTSLAVNLAVSLAEMWLCKVALVDLAVNSGQAALFLNLAPRYTLAELAAEALEDIPHELGRYLLAHSSGVSLLSAPRSAAMTQDLSAKLVEAFLPPLQAQFDYVVIDTMHHFGEATLAAIEHSDLLLLILTPHLAGAKATTDAFTVLDSIGYPKQQTLLVLNQSFPQEGLPAKQLEDVLGSRLVAILPYEGKSFVDAINRGTPLVTLAPNSPTTLTIQELAFRVSKPEMQRQEGPEISSLLGRVRKRLASAH